MPLLETSVTGIRLRNPLMNASGILGSRPEHVERLAQAGVSAFVSKSITPEPREGHPTPIIVELPGDALLNSVGLANPGPGVIPGLVETAHRLGIPAIISVAGTTPEDFLKVASIAEEAGADAVELNLSCPHAKGYGLEIGMDPEAVRRVVRTVSSSLRIPVWAKLGVVDRLIEVAGKALEAGAGALVLINTVRAMAIDVYARKPVLGHGVGGLSGRPLHPLAVRAVYEVYREYGAEIVGVGGVFDWRSAAELILAGARALQLGTALVLRGERVVKEILEGLDRYLAETGSTRLAEMVGAAVR